MSGDSESAISKQESDATYTLCHLSYWFGAFLGDGYAYWYPYNTNNKYGVGIDCMDADIVDKCYYDVQRAITDLKGNRYTRTLKSGTIMYQARWYDREWTEFMLHATNDKEKLPDYIWQADKSYKLQMLQGLMDTDGTISRSARQRESARMYYRLIFSGKKGFVRQFPDLLRVCGIKEPNIRADKRDGTVNFTISTQSAIENGFYFYCGRKAQRLEDYLADSYNVKGGRPPSF